MSMSKKRGTSHQPGRDTEHVLMAAFVTSGGRSGGWKLFNWIPQKNGGTYIYIYLYYIYIHIIYILGKFYNRGLDVPS
jgi:hypothetical protein